MVTRYETFVGVLPKTGNANIGFVPESFPASSSRASHSLRRKSRTYTDQKEPVARQPIRRELERREKTMNVRLPRVSNDNGAWTPISTNCSYVSKHKSYLRLKGFNLSNVYSLNRQKSDRKESLDLKRSKSVDQAALSRESINLPALFSPDRVWEAKRMRGHQVTRPDVWKPGDSAKLGKDSDRRSVRELDCEIAIPGYTPRDGVRETNRLGKILTTERMNELLNEEKPSLPRAFYTDINVFSPRSDIYSSI